MKKIALIMIVLSLSGCAGNFQAVKTSDGIIFKGNKQGFEMEYEETEQGIKASVNSKGEPLIKLELPEEFDLK